MYILTIAGIITIFHLQTAFVLLLFLVISVQHCFISSLFSEFSGVSSQVTRREEGRGHGALESVIASLKNEKVELFYKQRQS
jgi:hypothetical protein